MASTGKLAGKRAFITGAASGIGRATAVRFALDGARVALFDRNADGLRETTELISATPTTRAPAA